MNSKSKTLQRKRRTQAGLTIIETVLALAVLLVTVAGIMAVAVVAIPTTENQGHLSARATEYAQDKAEQLLALKFCDPTSDTTQFPATPGGGSGLTVGGSLPPAAPVNQYVDYLDIDGKLLGGGAAPPANWYYRRQWRIATLPSPAMTAPCQSGTPTTLLRISVAATVRNDVASSKSIPLPASTVSSVKSFPF